MNCSINWFGYPNIVPEDDTGNCSRDNPMTSLYSFGDVVRLKCAGSALFKEGLSEKTLKCTENEKWSEQIEDCSGNFFIKIPISKLRLYFGSCFLLDKETSLQE